MSFFRSGTVSSSGANVPGAPSIGTAYAGAGTGIVSFSAGTAGLTSTTGYTLVTTPGGTNASVSIAVSRTNLVKNPSFEGSVSGWGSTGLAATYSTAQAKVGSGSALLAYNGSTTVGLGGVSATDIPVTAGTAITFSFYALRSADIGQITYNHIFYAADGSTIISDYSHASIGASTPTTGWYRTSQTVVVPAGAAYTFPRIYITPGEGAGSTAFNAWIDCVLIETGANLQDYFDGTNTVLTPGRYSGTPTKAWTGTANASTSTFSGVNDLTGPYSGTVSGLTPGTSYTFQAYATNSYGNSSLSTPSNAISPTSSGVTINYLAVGGGGAGGSSAGGGGGAGGYVATTYSALSTSYAVVVGAGGTATPTNGNGNPGSASSAFGYTALGGGQGTAYGGGPGGNGGSGGGGGAQNTAQTGGLSTQNSTYGYGIGNSGGAGSNYTGGNYAGSGGGAGGVGQSGSSTAGPGLTYAINGSNYSTYAAGGPAGRAGTGQSFPGNATANTGNGGSGSGDNVTAGAGGSGIVIISYPTGAITATGGNISTANGQTLHTFLTNGTWQRTA